MSAGYDDRDRDDRYEDDDYDDRGPDRDRRGSAVGRVRAKVKTPAVVLLVVGVIGLLVALMNVVSVFTMDQQFARVEAQWDNDPNLKPEQRKELKQVLAQWKDPIKTAVPVGIGLSVVTGLITIFGAIQMMNLSGRGLAMAGSILSMFPFVSGCCCFGLPVGIWVLIVLTRPDVKAGFAAAGRSRGRDEY
jgi:hypothetical protein